MTEVCADGWDPFGCGWSLSSLWRWMDWIVRSDVILLGLMLVGIVAVGIRVSYRLRRGADLTDARQRRQLAADLGVGIAVVRSIIVAAPYLGLAGTCVGIMNSFIGIGMEKHAAMALISSLVAASLATAAAGVLVAISAKCVYHYSHRRLELVGNEESVHCAQRTGGFRLDSRLPLRARFGGPPAYALVAAPCLAATVGAFMIFWSAYSEPRGFAVDLAPVSCAVDEGRIILHVTDEGQLFLNESEKLDWNTLRDRVAEFYGVRADRTIYLVADSALSYQRVMDAIDLVESAEMPDGERIRVRLVTPKAEGGCSYRVLRRVLVAR